MRICSMLFQGMELSGRGFCGIHIWRTMALLFMLPQWDTQAQDYTYTTNDGSITITGYFGPGGAVTIPSMIDGLSVTSIGTNAFYQRYSVSSVTIPDSVTSIGAFAFYNSLNLTSVAMGNGVVDIGPEAFNSCSFITNLTLSTSLTNIESAAFIFCSRLRSIALPASLGVIGAHAFYQCSGLTSVVIPDGVGIVGDFAFAYDSYLTNIWIGKGVTNILTGAFSNCSRLSTIAVDPFNPVYSSLDGVLFNQNQTALLLCPQAETGSYVVPDGVRVVGNNAFSLCVGLTNLMLPDSVTNLGDGAFGGCSALSSINLPAGATNIGASVFQQSGVTNVVLPIGITNVGDRVFQQCVKLRHVTIPDGVRNIGLYAFYSCFSLTSVVVPATVTNLSANAFGSSGLKAVYFKGNAPNPGAGVFSGNTATVYYMPGTSGWGPTFAGRPTVLWNPRVQTTGASFGVSSNGFGFTITGSSNLVIVVEASSNLSRPGWLAVGTNTLVGGSSFFMDAGLTNFSSRYYRLRSP